MNKYRELFEKYVTEVGRAPHALTRVWVLGFCDWLARNESGLTQRAVDEGDSAPLQAESTPEILSIEEAGTTPALRN